MHSTNAPPEVQIGPAERKYKQLHIEPQLDCLWRPRWLPRPRLFDRCIKWLPGGGGEKPHLFVKRPNAPERDDPGQQRCVDLVRAEIDPHIYLGLCSRRQGTKNMRNPPYASNTFVSLVTEAPGATSCTSQASTHRLHGGGAEQALIREPSDVARNSIALENAALWRRQRWRLRRCTQEGQLQYNLGV